MHIQAFWSRPWRSLMAAVIMIITLAASVAMSTQLYQPLELGHYYEHKCGTGNSGTDQVLTLLLVTPTSAEAIASHLCNSNSVKQTFSTVKISWKPRTQLVASDLLNEKYDVIWNRQHYLSGLLPDFDSYYDTLLHYDNYAVYWLSLQSEPVSSHEYFQGKRIGLLNDSSSHTHYLLPLTSLREAGVGQDEYQAVVFDNAGSLYDSFYRGEIDLMTGGVTSLASSQVHRTLLDSSVTAATFFIRNRLQDNALRCDIVRAMELLMPLWDGIDTHQASPGAC